jgi:riboflavin biosynthesis pyrimidine reductase
VRQLFPVPTDASIAADLDALYAVPRPLLRGRPWVGVCMIASLDGAIAVSGASGGLGQSGDAAVFGALRRAADMILVGASTAATERYRPARKAGQRIGVVSRTANIDLSSDLFASGCGFLILPCDGPQVAGSVEVVRAGYGDVDLTEALGVLATWDNPPRFVQAEGGPRLNGALADAGCVDELNLSISPAIVGGDSARLVAGATEGLRPTRLAHVLADDDQYLFTRWIADHDSA